MAELDALEMNFFNSAWDLETFVAELGAYEILNSARELKTFVAELDA